MAKDPIQRLILEFARLPGLGERSAARLAFYVLRNSYGRHPNLAEDIADALQRVSREVRMCGRCFNYCSDEVCGICSDQGRESGLLCVVEGVSDLRAIEDSLSFKGRYHVLHGVLAPLEGVGPKELNLNLLQQRVEEERPEEVILATNTHVEGDATALYIARLLKPAGVRLTRLASGMPIGGELEYLDAATLERALSQRREC